MDREDSDEPYVHPTFADPTPATDSPGGSAPAHPVVVSICNTCKTSDGSPPIGPELFAAMHAEVGDHDPHVVVRRVQCLGVCKRPATVAVTSADGYTFLFGDLQTASGTAALMAFVESYRRSEYGLVPWRQRAEVLRKGMLSRVPPLRWSPADGSAPK